jgi:hypothetical protein
MYNDRRWDFGANVDGAQKMLIKEKSMKIWNLIGRFVCEYYVKEKRIDI